MDCSRLDRSCRHPRCTWFVGFKKVCHPSMLVSSSQSQSRCPGLYPPYARPVEAISACEKVAVWDRALSLLKRSCCNDIYGFSAAASACGNVAGCSNFLVHFFFPLLLLNICKTLGKLRARIPPDNSSCPLHKTVWRFTMEIYLRVAE